MQEHFWGLRRKELQKINHYLNKNIAGYLEENNYRKIKRYTKYFDWKMSQ
jgi:hypothetical protein